MNALEVQLQSFVKSLLGLNNSDTLENQYDSLIKRFANDLRNRRELDKQVKEAAKASQSKQPSTVPVTPEIANPANGGADDKDHIRATEIELKDLAKEVMRLKDEPTPSELLTWIRQVLELKDGEQLAEEFRKFAVEIIERHEANKKITGHANQLEPIGTEVERREWARDLQKLRDQKPLKENDIAVWGAEQLKAEGNENLKKQIAELAKDINSKSAANKSIDAAARALAEKKIGTDVERREWARELIKLRDQMNQPTKAAIKEWGETQLPAMNDENLKKSIEELAKEIDKKSVAGKSIDAAARALAEKKIGTDVERREWARELIKLRDQVNQPTKDSIEKWGVKQLSAADDRNLKKRIEKLAKDIDKKSVANKSIDAAARALAEENIGTDVERKEWAKRLFELKPPVPDHSMTISQGILESKDALANELISLKNYMTKADVDALPSLNSEKLKGVVNALDTLCDLDQTAFVNIENADDLQESISTFPQYATCSDGADSATVRQLCREYGLRLLSARVDQNSDEFQKLEKMLAANRNAMIFIDQANTDVLEQFAIVNLQWQVYQTRMERATPSDQGTFDNALKAFEKRLKDNVEAFLERVESKLDSRFQKEFSNYQSSLDKLEIETPHAFIGRDTEQGKIADPVRELWSLRKDRSEFQPSSLDDETLKKENLNLGAFNGFFEALEASFIKPERDRLRKLADEKNSQTNEPLPVDKEMKEQFETQIKTCFEPKFDLKPNDGVKKLVLKPAGLENFDFAHWPVFSSLLKSAAGTPGRILGGLFLLFAPLVLLGYGNLFKSATKGLGAGVEIDALLGFTAIAVTTTFFIAWVYFARLIKNWKKPDGPAELRTSKNSAAAWLGGALAAGIALFAFSLLLHHLMIRPLERSLVFPPKTEESNTSTSTSENPWDALVMWEQYKKTWTENELKAVPSERTPLGKKIDDLVPSLEDAIDKNKFNISKNALVNLRAGHHELKVGNNLSTDNNKEFLNELISARDNYGTDDPKRDETLEKVRIRFLQTLDDVETGASGAVCLLAEFDAFTKNDNQLKNWDDFDASDNNGVGKLEKCDCKKAVAESLLYLLTSPEEFLENAEQKNKYGTATLLDDNYELTKGVNDTVYEAIIEMVKKAKKHGLDEATAEELVREFKIEDELKRGYQDAKRLFLAQVDPHVKKDLAALFPTPNSAGDSGAKNQPANENGSNNANAAAPAAGTPPQGSADIAQNESTNNKTRVSDVQKPVSWNTNNSWFPADVEGTGEGAPSPSDLSKLGPYNFSWWCFFFCAVFIPLAYVLLALPSWRKQREAVSDKSPWWRRLDLIGLLLVGSMALTIGLLVWLTNARHSTNSVNAWAKQLYNDQSEQIELVMRPWSAWSFHLWDSWDPRSQQVINRSEMDPSAEPKSRFNANVSIWPCIILVGVLAGCFLLSQRRHTDLAEKERDEANRSAKQYLLNAVKKSYDDHQRNELGNLRQFFNDWSGSLVRKEGLERRIDWNNGINKLTQQTQMIQKQIAYVEMKKVRLEAIQAKLEGCRDKAEKFRDKAVDLITD